MSAAAKRVLITGSNGLLGQKVVELLSRSSNYTLLLTSKEEKSVFTEDVLAYRQLDVTEKQEVHKVVEEIEPDFIVHTAAMTNVDQCETDREAAWRTNVVSVENLVQSSKLVGAHLVHISTDYVFSGDRMSPYSETDPPDPKTAYGISKLAGEQFVKYLIPAHYVVRTCGLYGVAGCLGKGGGNFVENMIRKAAAGEAIKVVDDEIVGPTYTFDLAQKIWELVRTKKYGLYHITNSGQCSWWEFASEIFKIQGIDVKIKKTSAAEFKAMAHRPKFSILENKMLERSGLSGMRPWKEALRAYLEERGRSIR